MTYNKMIEVVMTKHHVVKSIEIGFIVVFAAILLALIFFGMHSFFGYGHVFPHPQL